MTLNLLVKSFEDLESTLTEIDRYTVDEESVNLAIAQFFFFFFQVVVLRIFSEKYFINQVPRKNTSLKKYMCV